MISKVEIQNFQCHKNTLVEFKDGLNVISGTSASGKSTIRRAILWVVTNRPTGTDIVSWWAKKGDKIKGETKVTLFMSDGTEISRVRSETLNGYIINGKTLEAVGTDVPPEVQEALNMTDINYSSQLEAPFLVSQSASYVAQYLNDIVDLGDADKFQSRVETLRRKCNSDMKDAQKKVEAVTKELASFDWIGKAEKLINKLKKLDTTQEEALLKKIDSLVREYEEASTGADTVEIILQKASPLVEKIQNIPAPDPLLPRLQRIIEEYTVTSKGLEDTANLEVAERLIQKLSRIAEASKQDEATVNILQGIFQKYRETVKGLVLIDDDIADTDREMDQVGWCPLCGSKLQEITTVF